jgi:hypothetical protein
MTKDIFEILISPPAFQTWNLEYYWFSRFEILNLIGGIGYFAALGLSSCRIL